MEKTPYDATPLHVTVSTGEHKLIAMALGEKARVPAAHLVV